jgi:hypothetical protein
MSERLRAMFDVIQGSGIEFNIETSEYENVFVQHRWEGFKECARIKDAEISRYKAEMNLLRTEVILEREHAEQLNAKVAMLRDYLTRIASPQGDITKWLQDNYTSDLTRPYEDCAYEALTATEADVNKWVNSMKETAVMEWRNAQIKKLRGEK